MANIVTKAVDADNQTEGSAVVYVDEQGNVLSYGGDLVSTIDTLNTKYGSEFTYSE